MTKLHILLVVLVLVGASDSASNLLGTNFIEQLGNYTNDSVSTFVYILIGLSMLYILFDRNTYLPFLGESVFPCSVLEETIPDGANELVKIKTSPNVLVVYWAAETDSTTDRGPQKAYGRYKNSGVVQSDKNGIAELSIRRPTGYTVPTRKLKAHVHYRECINNNMLSEVKTIFV